MPTAYRRQEKSFIHTTANDTLVVLEHGRVYIQSKHQEISLTLEDFEEILFKLAEAGRPSLP